MADPFVRPGGSFPAQIEHLITRIPGTGHPDITKYEWATSHHRDTLATMIGHHDLLSWLSVVENESTARTRFRLLEKMKQPCGKPPLLEDDDVPQNVD
ncbi:putative splicing factor 3B subunit 5 [Diplonema papillatum]|nr:putative splicing factor 3B subunit 5 [Diplonema papillatum]WGM49960.1 SF3B5 [Diplonema papillatum]